MPIIYEDGDAIKAFRTRFDVLCHGCNCHNTMNSGVAKSIKSKFPHVYEADCTTIKGDKSKLGTIIPVECSAAMFHDGKSRYIINAYTQFGYGLEKRHVSYPALRSCFEKVHNFVVENDFSICAPMIGAGRGGGEWSHIEEIINSIFDKYNITIFRFRM